ncbi:hypothetical protein GCM10027299_20090 [Larkinella ripae]
MKAYIHNLLAESAGSFTFFSGNATPTIHLRDITREVPNSPGLYFVFVEGHHPTIGDHLHFTFNSIDYTLYYFGKAGGITRDGRVIRQGLFQRINNVVNNDIPRAKYWDDFMQTRDIKQFNIKYILAGEDNPRDLEGNIYSLLNNNNLDYPIMNSRLGHP